MQNGIDLLGGGGKQCGDLDLELYANPFLLTLWVTEGVVNELCCWAEVLGDVEGGFVIGLHTKVLDVHVTVVIGASQHIIKLSLCCVKDMCNAQIPQARTLQSCFPATHRFNMQLPPWALTLVLSVCMYSLIPDVETGPDLVDMCVLSPVTSPEQLLQV